MKDKDPFGLDAVADMLTGEGAPETASPPTVQRLRLEPGDVVAVMYDLVLAHEQKERIAAAVHSAFPANRVLVLDGGARLAIMGPEQ